MGRAHRPVGPALAPQQQIRFLLRRSPLHLRLLTHHLRPDLLPVAHPARVAAVAPRDAGHGDVGLRAAAHSMASGQRRQQESEF